MSQRISLDTLDGAKGPEGSFAPCSFAAGEGPAPDCSAALSLTLSLARMEKDSAQGTCQTGRYAMRYRVWGQGPPLIIIPGLCNDAESFVLPMTRLSQRFCCITYDLPTGQGDGAKLATHGHDGLVDDLFALMDHLRIESAMLMGISFGSTIALRALALAPKRFTVGIVQGGFARRPLVWTEVLLAKFARYWPGPLSRVPLWRAVVEKLHRANFQAIEPLRWPYFLEHHGGTPTAAVAHRALLLNRVNLTDDLRKIVQPVLMICGDRDPLVGRACEEELRAGLPSVARAEIEECGHLPQFTHPEVLCEIIEQFLGMKERAEAAT